MKTLHIILFIAGIALQTMAYAQTEKGNWSTNGMAEYNYKIGEVKDGNKKSLSFAIGGGYFLFNNLQAGIACAYSYSYYDASLTLRHTEPLLYVKYYIGANRLRTYPYLAGGMSYQSSVVQQGTDNETFTRTKATLLRPGAGISYFVTSGVAIEALATYQLAHDRENDERVKKLNVKIGFGLYF